MKLSGNQFTSASMRLIAAAALASTLTVASGAVLAADKDAHADRVELRINDMHAKLKITPAEEAQWAKVALRMRDDAKTMDALTQSRVDHTKNMTAVDSLKSYGEIAEAHADGIKKLIPVFVDLYAEMSDAQKKIADNMFGHSAQMQDHKMMKGK